MIGFHGREPAAVAEAYDFAGVNVLVDVGGGTGNMIATVLARHPDMRGVLFDLPRVEQEARNLIQARDLKERITIQTGSFFDTVPAGGDAYLLSHIIHDWSEAQCGTILSNCRKAMKPDGRLLIVEMVLPSGDAPHPGKMLDMIMLAIPGGRSGPRTEYRELLSKAGFRLTRVVPTASAVSVVEAVIADRKQRVRPRRHPTSAGPAPCGLQPCQQIFQVRQIHRLDQVAVAASFV